jgi:hypothetical protein
MAATISEPTQTPDPLPPLPPPDALEVRESYAVPYKTPRAKEAKTNP